jgi:hypothetical protein
VKNGWSCTSIFPVGLHGKNTETSLSFTVLHNILIDEHYTTLPCLVEKDLEGSGFNLF